MTVRVQRGLPRQDRLESPSFRSRFRVPAAPRHLVHRARLTRLLDDLAGYPVTAVVAPAGAGKTVLAADWLRRRPTPAAWLTLEDADRDPAHLATALIAAVESLAPGPLDRARAAVHGPGGPTNALRVMAEDLEPADLEPAGPAGHAEAVLVVDDLHLVDDVDPTRSLLVSFVDHKPVWLHLLLLSRRRPELAVDRLRAAGELADVGFDALRFADPEATEMLAGLCPDTPREDLDAVASWSGGWAAALQLAALVLRSRRPAHPAVVAVGGDGPVGPVGPVGAVGTGRLVDSYLWHEVLRAEREELVELLLETAVVERMNYGLAEALTGRADAGDLLLEAEARGLFVSGFDSGGWFEVHGLVREALLAELERRSPDRLREQHARAARWLETMGDGLPAIGHWLDAGEPAEALRLLAGISMSGIEVADHETIDRILARIPPEVRGADPVSLLRFAWCRLMVDRVGFLDALSAAEAAAVDPRPSDRAASLGVLHATSAWLAGDWPASIDLGLAAVATPGATGAGNPLGRFGWSLVAHGLALDESWGGGEATAPEAFAGLSHEAARAVGLALAGHPLDSLRVTAAVERLAEHSRMPVVRSELRLAQALATRELGDPERAEPDLEALAAAPAYPCTYVPPLALLELVELRLGAGDLVGARSRFDELEEAVGRGLDGPGGRGWLARAGVLVALAADDPGEAERWSRRTDDSFWRPAGAARVHLAAGRASEAAEAADRAAPRSARHQVVRGLLLARAVREVDREAAAKSVEHAVQLAAGSGMLLTVAAHGAPVLDLVELAAWRVPGPWMDRLRRALAADVAPAEGVHGMVEQLTSRERDVMRLLPSRLTLREIASELYVSQNTLKFHLRVIYRKLGVNSRAEAVETARRLRLLARG